MRIIRAGVLLVLAALSGAAQADTDDQLWTSAGVRYRVTKEVRLDFTQHVRFDQDFSSLESVMPEISAAWSVQKWLRAGAGYRYSMERRKDLAFTPEHRLHLQAAVRGGVGPVSVSYRLRFQERLEFDPDLDTKHTVRNRVAMEYDTETRVTPGLTFEQFTTLPGGGGAVQEKRRQTGSIEYRPAKSHALELFLRRQLPLEDTTDPIERVIGVDYQYRIPRKK